jgi:hypothetical protein
VICSRALQGISPEGTTVFSQSLNWNLTADVTGGPWKGTKIKRRPQKDVSVFQGHRRKRHLLQGLPGNFPNFNWRTSVCLYHLCSSSCETFSVCFDP